MIDPEAAWLLLGGSIAPEDPIISHEQARGRGEDKVL